ncbi:MAG: T9SS type A sorting domain-containing protein [Muribaculaceae bacterium]|nr:T9SS type A sorting domain-containing protein [Muribaculaceae bacterium]
MRRFSVISFIAALALTVAPMASATTSRTESQHITATAEAVPTVKIVTGGAEITVPDDTEYTFNVYSITGQLVKTFKLADGSVTVELPRGCYIIKCEKWSKKIVIR